MNYREKNITNYEKLSDEKVLEKCEKFGRRALKWRTKFLGLLPEVNKRRLYEKKGFQSVFEFAFKTGGVSEKQVKMVLHLAQKFTEVPVLHAALVSGEVSANKLARVAAIATSETGEFWLNKTKVLSQNALEVFLRDEKILRKEAVVFDNEMMMIHHENESQIGLFKAQNGEKVLRTQKEISNDIERIEVIKKTEKTANINLLLQLKMNEETVKKLLALQEKGFNLSELIPELLQTREEKINQEKQEISTKVQEQAQQRDQNTKLSNNSKSPRSTKPSRYIPVKIRKIIMKEHGTKCLKPTCKKPSKQIHHEDRWSLTGVHDPNNMSPFCEEHHEIAHLIDIKYHQYKNNV